MRQLLLGIALLILWIAATPVFANWLNWRLASRFPPVNIKALPDGDAVILLGGASDRRILYALRVYRAGKAPRIVISGGNLPWGAAAAPEAERIAELLVEVGVPRSALILETKSGNTRENAINTAAIFNERGYRLGLLVTEGAHMPRALAAFRKAGIEVVPAPDNSYPQPFQVDSLLDLLPDAGALAGTTFAIKEMIGIAVYRLRDWA